MDKPKFEAGPKTLPDPEKDRKINKEIFLRRFSEMSQQMAESLAKLQNGKSNLEDPAREELLAQTGENLRELTATRDDLIYDLAA